MDYSTKISERMWNLPDKGELEAQREQSFIDDIIQKAHIEKEILKLVQSDFSGKIEVEEFDGVKVKFDGKNAVIGCSSKVQFARGVFLHAHGSCRSVGQGDHSVIS